MTIFFLSFGCKVNLYETENMKQSFSAAGHIVSVKEAGADIIIINSCTVTAMSDRKVRQALHHARQTCPDAVILLTGCFPQAFKEEAGALTDADIITGTKNRGDMLALIDEYLAQKKRIVKVSDYQTGEPFEAMQNNEFKDNTRAFVKIQDGCDRFCSYCIIPTARGRSRSKPLAELVSEVETLAAAGHKEIVLVGINLSTYGKGADLRLVDAIEACCKVAAVERVRLGSLEPELLTDEDIARMTAEKKLCPQFHLSLQSGCDRTLHAMRRQYTAAEYAQLVRKLRMGFPDAAITTDIMVGFPEESDADFEESLKFVKKMSFNKIHVFPYSARKGTIAAENVHQVDSKTKAFRAKQMMAVGEESFHDNLKLQLGKCFPVLFERENDSNFHQGYAPNYTLVKIPAKISDKSLRREIFYVRIRDIKNNYCIGEISEEENF